MTIKEIPEEKRKFYNWLCENIGIRIANLWLDGKWNKFIEEIKSPKK